MDAVAATLNLPRWATWVLTLAILCVVGVAGWFVKGLAAQTDANAESITTLQAERKADKEQLDRIERKLDNIYRLMLLGPDVGPAEHAPLSEGPAVKRVHRRRPHHLRCFRLWGRLMNTYDIGDVVRVQGTFTDPDNSDAPLDPSVVKATIRQPNGTTQTYTYVTDVEVTKLSTGVYRLEYTVTAAGQHNYRWFSTGTGAASDEAYFDVRASRVGA